MKNLSTSCNGHSPTRLLKTLFQNRQYTLCCLRSKKLVEIDVSILLRHRRRQIEDLDSQLSLSLVRALYI